MRLISAARAVKRAPVRSEPRLGNDSICTQQHLNNCPARIGRASSHQRARRDRPNQSAAFRAPFQCEIGPQIQIPDSECSSALLSARRTQTGRRARGSEPRIQPSGPLLGQTHARSSAPLAGPPNEICFILTKVSRSLALARARAQTDTTKPPNKRTAFE